MGYFICKPNFRGKNLVAYNKMRWEPLPKCLRIGRIERQKQFFFGIRLCENRKWQSLERLELACRESFITSHLFSRRLQEWKDRWKKDQRLVLNVWSCLTNYWDNRNWPYQRMRGWMDMNIFGPTEFEDLVFCSAGSQTQGLKHGRQALCHQAPAQPRYCYCTPNPRIFWYFETPPNQPCKLLSDIQHWDWVHSSMVELWDLAPALCTHTNVHTLTQMYTHTHKCSQA